MSEPHWLKLLRVAALIAAGVGAVVSVGLMLRAGNPPTFLKVLFAMWVLSPYVLFALIERVSTHWLAATRATLYAVMVVITVVTLLIYADVAYGPVRAQTAFFFVILPPASSLLFVTAVPIAAQVSRRRSRQGRD